MTLARYVLTLARYVLTLAAGAGDFGRDLLTFVWVCFDFDVAGRGLRLGTF